MSVQIHRCRFMDCERPGVSSLAFNYDSASGKSNAPSDLRVAVGRMNGDIEIWNPTRWNCDLVIPGAIGRTVEDMCWVKNLETNKFRLFSVGGTDTIVEWDLCTGLPKQMVRSDAGVVWALCRSPDGQQLAAATELGNVVVFDVSGDRLEPVRRLSGAGTSLASVVYQNDKEIVAGGSDGKLRVWSIQQNRIISVLRVDKQRSRGKPKAGLPTEEDGEETVVWTLLALPRTNQLVSGDSNGFVKVWDARQWTLQQSFAAHDADVLCLASNSDSTKVYSSGLDQKIVQTQLTDAKNAKWTVMASTVAHTHDIRCLAVFESSDVSVLVSGGLEPAFVVNNLNSLSTEQYRRVVGRGRVQALESGPKPSSTVVEWNEQQAQIWRVQDGRKLLARCRIASENLTSCCFDEETGLLACGSALQVRVFKLDGSSLQELNRFDIGVRQLRWAEPEKLVGVSINDEVLLLDCLQWRSESVVVSDEAETNAAALPYVAQISLLAVERGLLAIARHSGLVEVYTLVGKHVCTLPSLPNTITALGFRGADKLVVCTSDNGVYEFDALKGVLTPWARLNSGRMPKSLLEQDPIVGVFSDPQNAGREWIYGTGWLGTIDFSSQQPLPRDDEQAAVVEANTDGLPQFAVTTQYKPIFYAGNLDGAIVVSERAEKPVDVKRFWSNRRIVFS